MSSPSEVVFESYRLMSADGCLRVKKTDLFGVDSALSSWCRRINCVLAGGWFTLVSSDQSGRPCTPADFKR
jgi:hypothetical protein